MHLVFRGAVRRASGTCLLVAALAAPAGLAVVTPSRAAPELVKMFAIYEVRFAGLKLGKFKLWADLTPKGYAMRSATKLEMGFIIKGLFFKLRGGAETAGTMQGGRPRPASYALRFKTKRKRGKLNISFADDHVERVEAEPEMQIGRRAVPVTRAHKTNVFDPLTAAFLTMLKNSGKTHGAACKQNIPVFDGKHRFNLALSHKKTVRVKRSGKRGYSGVAVICRVKYAPVAGHTPNNKGLAFFQKTNDIEVWLIPVPGTRAYVPYHLSLPTPRGHASAISTVFDVETVGQGSRSLVR